MITINPTEFVDRVVRSIETSLAVRKDDYLRVIQLQQDANVPSVSACIYAWYRLGCYQKVVELAEDYLPKRSPEIAAISVSLAAMGRFEQCEAFVSEHLEKLKKEPRYAIEAARGVVKFIPSLAQKLCEGIENTSDLRAAAHFVFGKEDLARTEFKLGNPPRRRDVVAGHYFLKANLALTTNAKLAAVNQQMAEFDLAAIRLENRGSDFRLDSINNDDDSSPFSGPLVSIIVPAFNAETDLRMSISSLLQQSYFNLEVIIVNDGSTDNTARLAQEFAASDPRVRVIHLKRNYGAYAARNKALKEASGEFVSIHDSDDFAHVQKIERQVRPMLRDKRLLFSISDMVRIAEDGIFARREVYPLQRLNTSSLTFRKDQVLRECGIWEEERFGADSEYFFRLRNHYSRRQWLRLRQPLTFAAEKLGSLTARISTGGLRQPSDPRRTAYTESYTQRWLHRPVGCADG
ncbi:glycosyltransferase family 2 protein [Ruegeria profundi]|uniref:glycosyltransferase family 2 protein n=1 Tax=Ruegeria profundi TaxID=1685378 RepID=UPI001CD456DB|nr:glycosyltransferase family 2 protein [Ruegeria profundi]MCA0930417.1 glycosyltransferase [Ruegeria profundi]